MEPACRKLASLPASGSAELYNGLAIGVNQADPVDAETPCSHANPFPVPTHCLVDSFHDSFLGILSGFFAVPFREILTDS